MRVNVWDAEAGWLETSVDYRRTGTRAGMPDKVPFDRCERVRGINIYTDADLVRRKLVTVVGPRPRQKARDIYDAAWVVSHRPELVLPDDAAKLRQWLDGLIPRAREELQRRLRSEEVTGRVSAAQVWNALEAGVRTLGPAPPGRGSGGAGPGSSPPPLDPGLPDGGGASLGGDTPVGAPSRPVIKSPPPSGPRRSRPDR